MNRSSDILALIVIALVIPIMAGCNALHNQRVTDWTPQDMVNATVVVRNSTGWGSGVLIGENVILTARHVVRGRWPISVLHGSDTYDVIDIHLDPDSDLALIHVAGLDFERPASLLDRKLVLGEPVWLTGTPISSIGLRDHLAVGVVSNPHSGEENVPGWEVLVNIDAYFGSGGSGGPVWVGGSVAAVYVGGWFDWGGSASGLSFAVPVSELDAF